MSNTTLPILEPSGLDFSGSADWVNRTERFYLPVGPLEDGGEPLVYPADHPRAGEPLSSDPNARGVIVVNGKDRALQGVKGDGTEGFMINCVDLRTAYDLYAMLCAKFSDIPFTTSPERIKEFLLTLRQEHNLDDVFQKDECEVLPEHEQLEQLGDIDTGDRPFGYFRCRKATKHKAIFVPMPFALRSGPVPQEYPNGAVVVTNGSYVWGIASDVFLSSFWRQEGEVEERITTILENTPGLPVVTSIHD